jgi:TonB family protein
MISLFEYLVKSSIALSIFYIFYWLFLKNDTHFLLNRFVLSGSLFLAAIVPLISLNILSADPVIPSFNINFESTSLTASNTPVNNTTTWNLWQILAVIYFSGAALVLLRLIYQGIYMRALSRLSKSEKHQNYTLVFMDKDIVPFSYFKKVFIPSSQLNTFGINSIIDHEKSHLQQLHFIDLFLAELITIVQWFNPFAWLYEQSIKETHEYLADKAVLDQGYSQGNYQALLVNQAMGGPVFTITHQFNQSLIKKRIVMMTKMKSPRMAALKSFMMLPLVALLLMAYANPQKSIPSKGIKTAPEEIYVSGTITSSQNGKPISGAAIVIKGSTTGTISDQAGNFKIQTDKNADLAVSFVGYKTQLVPVNGNTVINIQMDPQPIAIDLDKKENSPQKETQTNEKGDGNFVIIEEPPTYPGGNEALMKFLVENLKYPDDAKANRIEGKVYAQIIVDKNGNATSVKLIRGVSTSIDKEAFRVASLLKKWNPGKQNGNAIDCAVTLPIEFKL